MRASGTRRRYFTGQPPAGAFYAFLRDRSLVAAAGAGRRAVGVLGDGGATDRARADRVRARRRLRRERRRLYPLLLRARSAGADWRTRVDARAVQLVTVLTRSLSRNLKRTKDTEPRMDPSCSSCSPVLRDKPLTIFYLTCRPRRRGSFRPSRSPLSSNASTTSLAISDSPPHRPERSRSFLTASSSSSVVSGGARIGLGATAFTRILLACELQRQRLGQRNDRPLSPRSTGQISRRNPGRPLLLPPSR